MTGSQTRLHMHNATHLVEFPATLQGWLDARLFRRDHVEFKGKRIREVLQLMPDAVPCGVMVERT